MNNFRPCPFINFTPIESGITFVDLGRQLHEDASQGVEVPRDRSISLPPISAPRLHSTGGRHGSLPPMTPTSILEVEENAQGVRETRSDRSAELEDTTSSQGEPDNSEVPLRNSQVSKAK
jgi:hypothetical protein